MTRGLVSTSAISLLVACSGSVKNSDPPASSSDVARAETKGDAPRAQAGVCPGNLAVTVPELSSKTVPAAIAGVPAETTFSFLEGPVWLGDALYMSYIVQVEGSKLDSGHILKYTPGGVVELFASDVGTNGMAISPDGLLLAASHKVGGIVAFNTKQATEQVLVEEYAGHRFNSPNDLAVRADGTIYFTDPNYQCGSCSNQPTLGVYRLLPNAAVELLTTIKHDPPNGIALSPDGSTLYVGGSTLRAYPVAADGSVGEGADFGNLSGTDGLGIDCAGNVYVALFNENRVAVVKPNGEVLPGGLSVPHPTNVAFGGTDSMTLFVTNQEDNGAFRAIAWDIPGYPY